MTVRILDTELPCQYPRSPRVCPRLRWWRCSAGPVGEALDRRGDLLLKRRCLLHHEPLGEVGCLAGDQQTEEHGEAQEPQPTPRQHLAAQLDPLDGTHPPRVSQPTDTRRRWCSILRLW